MSSDDRCNQTLPAPATACSASPSPPTALQHSRADVSLASTDWQQNACPATPSCGCGAASPQAAARSSQSPTAEPPALAEQLQGDCTDRASSLCIASGQQSMQLTVQDPRYVMMQSIHTIAIAPDRHLVQLSVQGPRHVTMHCVYIINTQSACDAPAFCECTSQRHLWQAKLCLERQAGDASEGCRCVQTV